MRVWPQMSQRRAVGPLSAWRDGGGQQRATTIEAAAGGRSEAPEGAMTSQPQQQPHTHSTAESHYSNSTLSTKHDPPPLSLYTSAAWQ